MQHCLSYKVKWCESRSVVSDSLWPHGLYRILQARILEWVAFPFSRVSSQPRDRTQVSCIAGRFFTNWAVREAPPSPQISHIVCDTEVPGPIDSSLLPCACGQESRRALVGWHHIPGEPLHHPRPQPLTSVQTSSRSGNAFIHPLIQIHERNLYNGEVFFLTAQSLLLAALSLGCCARASSRGGTWGSSSSRWGASHSRDFSLTEPRLSAPGLVGSSQTRDWTRVPCIGTWILIHHATREVQGDVFILSFGCQHWVFRRRTLENSTQLVYEQITLLLWGKDTQKCQPPWSSIGYIYSRNVLSKERSHKAGVLTLALTSALSSIILRLQRMHLFNGVTFQIPWLA